MKLARGVKVVTLICELCAEPIFDEDLAVVMPEGWWCSACANRIDVLKVVRVAGGR